MCLPAAAASRTSSTWYSRGVAITTASTRVRSRHSVSVAYAGLEAEPVAVQQDLAAQEGEDGLALQLPAVPVAVAGLAVQGALVHGPAEARVDHHQVGVGARGEGALARRQPEDPGRGAAQHFGQSGEGDAARGHPLAGQARQ